jgi:hypothetical protein
MIDFNRIFYDLMNIRNSDQCEEILHNAIVQALERMRSTTLELYSDKEHCADFMLFFMFRALEDMLDYYEISEMVGDEDNN